MRSSRVCRCVIWVLMALVWAAAPTDALSGPTSFARYLLFTGTHTMPNGGAIRFRSRTSLDGPVHTNGQFYFWGQPAFADSVDSASDRAWFYNNGTPVQLADDHNDVLDVPQFQRGFQRGVPPIALPANSYDQQKAALGLAPDGMEPTNQAIRAALGFSGSTPPPNGIYLPNTALLTTGGIYVQGVANQILASADTASHRQSFRITQGATVKTIVIDPNANTTSVTVGATTAVYMGTLNGVLCVNGQVSDFRGPFRIAGTPPPAILDGQRVLLAATGDIVLTTDLTVQNFSQGSGVLGIFSSAGSVRIGPSALNDILLDAFVMAVGPDGAFAVDNYNTGSPRGTFRLRGGCVESYYGPFGAFASNGTPQAGYARDFRFDTRGWTPPQYPTVPSPAGPAAVPMVARLGGPTVRLSSPRPNPSRGSMRVAYSLSRAGRVRLSLFDVSGRRVATLLDAERSAGEHEVQWTPGGSLGVKARPGVYLLQLESAGERACVRVMLLAE